MANQMREISTFFKCINDSEGNHYRHLGIWGSHAALFDLLAGSSPTTQCQCNVANGSASTTTLPQVSMT